MLVHLLLTVSAKVEDIPGSASCHSSNIYMVIFFRLLMLTMYAKEWM